MMGLTERPGRACAAIRAIIHTRIGREGSAPPVRIFRVRTGGATDTATCRYRTVVGFAGQLPGTSFMRLTSKSGSAMRSWPMILSVLFVSTLADGWPVESFALTFIVPVTSTRLPTTAFSWLSATFSSLYMEYVVGTAEPVVAAGFAASAGESS